MSNLKSRLRLLELRIKFIWIKFQILSATKGVKKNHTIKI